MTTLLLTLGRVLLYLLQGFGIMLLAGGIMPIIFGAELYNSALFGLAILATPIVYTAIRVFLDYNERTDCLGRLSANHWRRFFDRSSDAAALLKQVQSLQTRSVLFLFDYPPGERPAKPKSIPRDPMYGSPRTKPEPPPVFAPQMRVLDHAGRQHSLSWPFPNVQESMSMFPWWLAHQLGSGKYRVTRLIEHSSGRVSTTSFSATPSRDGGYSVSADYYEPSEYHYGWMVKAE